MLWEAVFMQMQVQVLLVEVKHIMTLTHREQLERLHHLQRLCGYAGIQAYRCFQHPQKRHSCPNRPIRQDATD